MESRRSISFSRCRSRITNGAKFVFVLIGLYFFFFFFSTREMEVSEKDEIERVKYRAERKMLFDKFD